MASLRNAEIFRPTFPPPNFHSLGSPEKKNQNNIVIHNQDLDPDHLVYMTIM